MSKITSEELRKLLYAATPGPWFATKANEWEKLWIEQEDGDGLIMSGSGGARSWTSTVIEAQSYDNSDNNMKLIALAPDLAAELLDLRERNARQQEMAGKLVEALRFARGWRDAQDMSHVDFRIEVGKRAEAAISEREAGNG